MRMPTVVAAVLVSLAASLVAPAATGSAAPAAHGAPRPGYWLVGGDGGVFAFNAPFEGSGAPLPGVPGLCPFSFGPTINVSTASEANSGQVLSDQNCVGIAGSAHGSGYWVANFSSMPSAFGSRPRPTSWAAPA